MYLFTNIFIDTIIQKKKEKSPIVTFFFKWNELKGIVKEVWMYLCARLNMGAEIAIRQKQYLLKKMSKVGKNSL